MEAVTEEQYSGTAEVERKAEGSEELEKNLELQVAVGRREAALGVGVVKLVSIASPVRRLPDRHCKDCNRPPKNIPRW